LSTTLAEEALRVRSCRTCRHFDNDPAHLEASFPGWASMGSAWGSTRSDDGICGLRAIYLSAGGCCAQHSARD
jgi:hypothetical protein